MIKYAHWLDHNGLGIVIKKADQFEVDQYYLVGHKGSMGTFDFNKNLKLNVISFDTEEEREIVENKKNNGVATGNSFRVIRLNYIPDHFLNFHTDVLSRRGLCNWDFKEGDDLYGLQVYNIENLKEYYPILRKGSFSLIEPSYRGKIEYYIAELNIHYVYPGPFVLVKHEGRTKLIGMVKDVMEKSLFSKYRDTVDLVKVHFMDEVVELIELIEAKNTSSKSVEESMFY